jgi:alkaline phosphatase D
MAAVAGVPLVASSQKVEGTGLIAHWPFDRDFSSSMNNARYEAQAHGGEMIHVDHEAGAARVGTGALRLRNGPGNSESAYLAVANPPAGLHGTAVLTFSAWFKLSNLGGIDPRNFVWESIPNSAFSFSLGNVSQRKSAQFRFRSENYRVLSETQGPAVSVDEWHHVVSVWNALAGYVRFYIDGELVKELSMKNSTVGGNVAQTVTPELGVDHQWPGLEPVRGIHLGGNKFGDGRADWDGWIDDVAIYDLELTPRQIGALARNRAISAINVLEQVPEPAAQVIAGQGREVPALVIPAHESLSQGPLIGHVDAHQAVVWARVPQPGNYTLVATSEGQPPVRLTQASAENDDWCMHWRLEGLRADTIYRVVFELPDDSPFALPPLTLRTAVSPETPARVALGFGSCADFPDNSIWTKIAEECPDGMVLLGDTPYIDTTKLPWMRWAYRRFSSIPQFARAFQKIPFWGTWDDHDFGANNSDGTLPAKDVSRRAFVEYRPMVNIGEQGLGTYTSFRRGPIEVFLLDTRWFSRTERSWADSSKPTLLGRQQWEWLQRGLRASTAPFKVLACGIVWDGKGDSPESDAWGSFLHEREALFRWLGDNAISGVVLVGGDIHVSRLIKFPVREQAGYDLYEFITSPMHDRVFPQANVPDVNLVDSAVEPWVFLKLTADNTGDEPVLVAELMNRDGKQFFRREILAREVTSAAR